MTLRARFQMVRNQMPLIMERALPQKDWFLFFSHLYTAATDGMSQPEEASAVPASPAVYTAVIRGQANIRGGTVSLVEFSRDGTNWYPTGIVQGFVMMNTADRLRITYTVLPTLTFFPM